jgi:putative oxidoreductase
MNVLKKLIATPNDPLLTILRLTLGIIFVAHGAQLTLGLFGGHGFSATMEQFTNVMNIPAPLAFAAIMAEFVGGIALILGLAARLAALSITVNMLVAIVMVHAQNGLFMNWFGTQKGEGFEYHLLAIAVALPIIFRGSGALSVDRLLMNLPPRDVHPNAVPSFRRFLTCITMHWSGRHVDPALGWPNSARAAGRAGGGRTP